MSALNPTRQNALLLVALLFAQLLLMAGSTRRQRGSTLLELGLLGFTRPAATLSGAVGGTIRGTYTGIRDLLGAHRDNERLQARVHALQIELERYREDAQENRRLRRLLGMREELAPQSIGASVVTAALSGQERTIVVDRGSADAVHADLPVLAWGGAVGRVVSAGRHVSQVRLLTDPNSGVAGIIQRTRVEGMIVGQGEDRSLEMLYVPRFSDVMLGDRVVTSGLDGVFPRGVGIGRVVYVGEDSGISKVIRVRPEVDFSGLEEVLVLLEPVAGGLLETAEGAAR